MSELIPMTAISTDSDEARVLDLDLARWLGISQVRNIRSVIAANIDELQMHGGLHVANANPGARGGRPGKAYYLNEGQALVICALSRTAVAAQVRKALIEVFQAYRAGKLVHVKEHRRSLPNKFPRELRSREFKRAAEKLDELLEGTETPEALIAILTFQSLAIQRLETRLSEARVEIQASINV